MPETGLATFDTTVQKTNGWIRDVMAELGTTDRHRAYSALRCTLHALRDRLPPAEAVEIAAQFPMLLRGVYYEGWRPSETPRRERTKLDFLRHVAHEAHRAGELPAEGIARAVFRVLAARVSAGEIDDVKRLLPAEIRDLWPAPEAD